MLSFSLERCGVMLLILNPHFLKRGVNTFVDFRHHVTLKKKNCKRCFHPFSVYKRTEGYMGLILAVISLVFL